jgi:hypothetical protein
MNITCAVEFLQAFGSLFGSDEVRNWVWTVDDDEAGKRTSWTVGDDPAVEAVASVDLMEGQLQLTVTERGLGTSSEDVSTSEPQVLFDALIQFDEQTVIINSEPLPYTVEAISLAIRQFSERA